MKSPYCSHAVCLIGMSALFLGTVASPARPVEPIPIGVADPKILETLDSLGDNCSALLPALRTAGDLNDVARKFGLEKTGPGQRDYCIKLAWMPDRKRAIFYGANHGVPHRLNDVWEYDLPSNTWVCLYGPDPSKNAKADYKDVDWENVKEGVIRTKRGGPAILPHSWWNLTYDPEMKAMLTFCSWSMSHPGLFKLLQAGKHKPPLWAFYPSTGKWEPIVDSKFEGPKPAYENARSLEYVPELGGSVWTKSDGMWLYNSRSNTWKSLGSRKDYPSGLPAREQVTVYVPDRKLIVAHDVRGQGGSGGKGFPASRTSHYDTGRNTWTTAFEGAEMNNPPAGFDARTNFVYDSVGKVCLLWDRSWTKALWAYDPSIAKWEKLEPKGPPPPVGRDSALAYYDEARNVFVIPGQWIYRFKKRGP